MSSVKTELGPLNCSTVVDQEVHRIGYAPAPWDWTPWKHAQGGRFDGRWDDPDGNWRALYVGDCALACYLEVLAPFRPDPVLAQQLAEIVVGDDDHFHRLGRENSRTHGASQGCPVQQCCPDTSLYRATTRRSRH